MWPMDETPPNAAPGKDLTPAARRALEEAEVRRQAAGRFWGRPNPGGRLSFPTSPAGR